MGWTNENPARRGLLRKGSLALVLLLLAAGAWAPAPAGAKTGAPSLQFTSQGHVLGFGAGFYCVAAGDRAMKITWAGGRSVSPMAERCAGPADAGRNGRGQAFKKVTYAEVWDGVTAVFEKSDGAILKSSFRVRAGVGGRPVEHIRLIYDRPVRVDRNGDLVVSFERGEMRERAPVAWQEACGARAPVAVAYRLFGEREVGFEVSGYDAARPLVIDPTLTWNTFLGGSGTDYGRSVAVDSAGNVYVTGYSNASWGSPLRAYSANYDAYVAKLNASGVLEWHTFLGGSGLDDGRSIAVDGSGNIYVAGYSAASWGSPVRLYTAGNDAFVAKLDSSGALLWNTFLGGTGTDYGIPIVVDSGGNVFVAGMSSASWGSPVRPYTGGYDVFAAKLNTSGALQWNTFLGGTGTDYCYGITLDGSGNVYLAAYSNATWGSPVRPYTGNYDAFAAKLNGSGALQWHTFLGGTGIDNGRSIVVDATGAIFIGGISTATWGSPLRAYSADYDAFLARLDSGGNLLWNLFLGGSGADYGYFIGMDGSSNIYIAGYSTVSWGSPIRGYSAGDDAYAAKVDSNGNLLWNLFLGGSGSDRALSLALDASRNLYLTGYSNASWGSPVRAYSAGYDAFVAKIPETPTLIELASFEATPRENFIALTWKTASEKDNLGFHLWRADGGSPDYRRITTALIPATGDAVSGAQYAYQDFDVIPGESYSYKLEDIDTAGVSAFHGPVSAVMGTITPLAPEDGTIGWVDSPLLFAWDGSPYVQFKLEFSASPDFTAAVIALPTSGTKAPGKPSWTTETRLVPTLAEWRLVRTLSPTNGVVFWRIRGRTASGGECVSEACRLTILTEARLPARPLVIRR